MNEPITDAFDIYRACEDRARALHEALLARGVENETWVERNSPTSVRIPLAPSLEPQRGDASETEPSEFVTTEGVRTVSGQSNTWVWAGSFGNFTTADLWGMTQLDDTFIEWIERHWLNEDVDQVDRAIQQFVAIVKNGAQQAVADIAAIIQAEG